MFEKRVVFAALFIIVILFLSACAAKPDVEPSSNETAGDENVSAEEPSDAGEPAILEEAEAEAPKGRVVFYATSKVADDTDVEKLELQVSDVQILIDREGEEEYVDVAGGRPEFSLTELEGNALIAEAEVEAGRYTMIKLRFRDVKATIGGKETELELASSYAEIRNSVFRVEEGKTTAVGIELQVSDNVVIIGDKGYLLPSISVTATEGAEVNVSDENKVSVSGGEETLRKEFGQEGIFSEAQIAGLFEDCTEDCSGSCTGSGGSCESECKGGTSFGCASEDEDTCRDKCEPYLNLVVCRDACREDSAECTDDLGVECIIKCDNNKKECAVSCEESCALVKK